MIGSAFAAVISVASGVMANSIGVGGLPGILSIKPQFMFTFFLAMIVALNVENNLQDANSIFYHYQRLVELRKEYDIIAYGEYQPIIEQHDSILAYIREYKNQKLLVISNFYGNATKFELPPNSALNEYRSEILISNYADSPKDFNNFIVRAYESIVYYLEK